jgi:hypothetical protein
MHRSTALFALLAIALGGCATLPGGRAESALYVDVRKAVALRESAEWIVDRLEVEGIAQSVMRSACQVDAPARERLIGWLDARIADAGGPAEAAYRRNREAPIDEALSLERVRAVVQYADAHAHECPFWLEVDPYFDGVQTDARRFVLLAESFGGGGLILSRGGVRLGGGGGGRLTLAWGLDQRLTLGVGAEVGGIGTFGGEDDSGARALVARFTAAVPLVLRITNLSRILDLELAPNARWSPSDLRLPPGVRVGVAYGVSTVRVGPFMPTAMLYLRYEYLPASRDGIDPSEHLILVGTKVGIDFDP